MWLDGHCFEIFIWNFLSDFIFWKKGAESEFKLLSSETYTEHRISLRSLLNYQKFIQRPSTKIFLRFPTKLISSGWFSFILNYLKVTFCACFSSTGCRMTRNDSKIDFLLKSEENGCSHVDLKINLFRWLNHNKQLAIELCANIKCLQWSNSSFKPWPVFFQSLNINPNLKVFGLCVERKVFAL